MNHLCMGSDKNCPCRITAAELDGEPIQPDKLLRSLRDGTYAIVTIDVPLLNREGYRLYPRKALGGTTAHLEYWNAYSCWLDDTPMVFIPEKHGENAPFYSSITGLLLTQASYDYLRVSTENAEHWYKVVDHGIDIQIEPVDIYLATDLSVYDGTAWHDRNGTYQSDMYFTRYDGAYAYVCGMYDSMIYTLQSKLLAARMSYTKFHSEAMGRAAA